MEVSNNAADRNLIFTQQCSPAQGRQRLPRREELGLCTLKGLEVLSAALIGRRERLSPELFRAVN